MSARERILARVRRASGGEAAHPGPYAGGGAEGGFEAFAAALRAAGGDAHGPHPPEEAARAAARIAAARAGAGRVLASREAIAQLGEAGPWRPAPRAVAPHALAGVAVAVLAGRVGVAESGAAAVELREGGERALAFLARHVVLALPAERVAPELGEAFARLGAEALAGGALVWMAGPSKTADIELALVKGAHGPLTLDVLGVAGGAGEAER